MGPASRLAVLASLAVAAASAAANDVAGELLRPGERVSSSLAKTGERKLIALAGVEGSTLDVAVDVPSSVRAAPRLSILPPGGGAAIVGTTTSRRRARIKGLALPVTGVWRVVVESAPGAGGAFTVATRAAVPFRFAWTGAVSSSAPVVDHVVPAAPGGRLTVVVTTDAASAPLVEIVAPSGEVVASKTATDGRATIAGARLVELGRYVVRVSGADGAFAARATVARARSRRPRFRDVEAAPDVVAFGPATTENQLLVTFYLGGVGFSDGQVVSLVEDGRAVATGVLRRFGGDGASAVLDLADVVPGSYSVVVATASGHLAAARESVVVVERAPHVDAVDGVDFPNANPFALTIRGHGFDADAAVSLRRASDSLDVPLVVSSRVGHETIVATATPPAFATGRCDLEVRDADGGIAVAAGAVDLLGYRAAPTAALTYSGVDAPLFAVRDAAFDFARGRALLAVRENATRAAFVLFDAATSSVLDTLTIDAGDAGLGGVDDARVSFDAVGGTFALCLLSRRHPCVARVTIVSATDLRDVRGQADLQTADTTYVDGLRAAAARDFGGYLVTWDAHDAVYGARVLAQTFGVTGATDSAARKTLAWDPFDNVAYPVAAYQGSGRFVVAWAGLTDDYKAFAVRAAVVDAQGAPVPGLGPYVVASSAAWTNVSPPELAVNPDDGAALVAFSHSSGVVDRPSCTLLSAATAYPGVSASLDQDFPFAGGLAPSVVWNPARGEFVAVVATFDGRVALRRVGPDGALRLAPVVLSYEGTSGVVYAGTTSDALGLARAFDGTADDSDDASSQTRQALVGAIR